MPAAARVLRENGIAASEIAGSGPGGRVLKEDAKAAVKAKQNPKHAPAPKEALLPRLLLRCREAVGIPRPADVPASANHCDASGRGPKQRRDSHDLQRGGHERGNGHAKEFQEEFISAHGIKLGFVLFIKASIEALKRFPGVNTRIDGKDVIYHHYYDIGVAIGGEGLVVPVIRNAERLSMAGVEQSIAEYAKRAKDGSIRLDELQGYVLDLNGGAMALCSTPILGPPQSGILGLHNIKKEQS